LNHRYESKTRKENRKLLTEYWEARGVIFAKGETIDDCIVVPGDKTDWLFYPAFKWIKEKIKHVKTK